MVHGCCDGKSKRIMFLRCSTNNLTETVLDLFKDAIKNNRGLWPSRIHVGRGVETVLIRVICFDLSDETVTHWGKGRHSFIAGSSTSNQRIERLWRDVFRCVCHFFISLFILWNNKALRVLRTHPHLFLTFSLYTKNQVLVFT